MIGGVEGGVFLFFIVGLSGLIFRGGAHTVDKSGQLWSSVDNGGQLWTNVDTPEHQHRRLHEERVLSRLHRFKVSRAAAIALKSAVTRSLALPITTTSPFRS